MKLYKKKRKWFLIRLKVNNRICYKYDYKKISYIEFFDQKNIHLTIQHVW